ncbi:3-deoxy-7-phosphoheptulonate synthase [Streptomyces sp. NPDC090499]|uniref:3-deoxy-7-phosphoheptulonate synthase n=1 Tax=Streptomyces sp. NPDC090499 TaxID=3365965 RepID=UPI003803DEC5
MNENTATRVQRSKALQQPEWPDLAVVSRVRQALAGRPALVRPEDLTALRHLLAEVAQGRAQIVQAGDCAEDPAQCTAHHVRRKSSLIDALARAMAEGTGQPVVRVGRLGGQFAKPRSGTVEVVEDRALPVYRGHLVNGPDPTPEARRPDPSRILSCHTAATAVMAELDRGSPEPHRRLWTSHEALLLDYELPLLRQLPDGRHYLGSTHWPWIGERTRQPDGAHVELLSSVVNPVACKVGPDAEPYDLIELCTRLDPDRVPGRLTLIARLGADTVRTVLTRLVQAVRAAGHPVIWLCDPLHGNTVTGPAGRKTRLVSAVEREVTGFRETVQAAGGTAGGLHLETTPDDVRECVDDLRDAFDAPQSSLCDPRLNASQAHRVVAAWTAHR